MRPVQKREAVAYLLKLVLYVFLYLRRVLSYRVYVVTTAPELPVSVLEFQIAKLLIKHQTTFAFQIPHEARNTHLRRNFQKHMDVIHTAFRFQNIHVFPFAQLS